MVNLTAADFADTGQWRLLLKIGYTGLEAFLENTLHPELEQQQLCSATWEFNKDMLRQHIEDAVYNNPRLLDDFSARIILYDPRTLFMPTKIAEEYPDAEEELYQKVYTAEKNDIMTDADKDLIAAWSLAPGIKNFLMRTFPGARITCNLMDKVKELRKECRGKKLYTLARKNEVDLIFLDNENLVSASTHEWTHPDDIAYLVINLLDIYSFEIKDVSIVPEGVSTDTEVWKFIRENREVSGRK